MNDRKYGPAFTDHYFILGIDIDATGEMVEQMYWQRIRASRNGASGARTRPQDIIALNEAYRVLMMPELRASYDAARTEAFGADAAPRGPEPERSDLPLRVMETQLPAMQIQAASAEQVMTEGWSLPVPAWLLAGGGTALATVTVLAVRWLLF